MKRVAVFGAGVTGLAAAWKLQQLGLEVEVFDPALVAGGVVRTVEQDGYVMELGPNTVLEKGEALTEWLDGLGLRPEVRHPGSEAKKRFIWHEGRAEEVPMTPWGFAASRLMSVGGKLRLLAEPFCGAGTAGDESVAAFFRRRVGEEAVARLVDPMVSGIYAGDVVRLSARHCFPKLWAWEREAGSLVRGALRGRGNASGRRGKMKLVSFEGGLQRLPQRAAEVLGERVHLGTSPQVRRDGGGWEVEGWGGFDAVVAAMPWAEAGRWLGEAGIDGGEWPRMTSAAVRVWHFGVKREAVRHALDGFGVLAPSVAGEPVLGMLFSSTLFAGRAPEGRVLLTVFQGGVRQPEWCRVEAEAEAKAAAWAAASRWLGVAGEPEMVHGVLWGQAIPQYEVGHGRVLEMVEAVEGRHRGLVLAGNYRGGVAVGDCVATGFAVAERVRGM